MQNQSGAPKQVTRVIRRYRQRRMLLWGRGSQDDSIDHLHQESLTMKVKDHSDMLSAQYLGNCLEEDHVCHGITTQEPSPRPMKETLHSRHHSTILPRLGASRKESLRNLHTHAVDSDTQLLGNNRVLKESPPPIADEEQGLNRRQRCTLSQLRSGHCHQLQDHKHMVFGEPSDICTDCGASPQDVRHLFICNKHSTDLSTEDLCRNPVRSTRCGTVRRHTIACESRSHTILTVCCSSQRVFGSVRSG